MGKNTRPDLFSRKPGLAACFPKTGTAYRLPRHALRCSLTKKWISCKISMYFTGLFPINV